MNCDLLHLTKDQQDLPYFRWLEQEIEKKSLPECSRRVALDQKQRQRRLTSLTARSQLWVWHSTFGSWRGVSRSFQRSDEGMDAVCSGSVALSHSCRFLSDLASQFKRGVKTSLIPLLPKLSPFRISRIFEIPNRRSSTSSLLRREKKRLRMRLPGAFFNEVLGDWFNFLRQSILGLHASYYSYLFENMPRVWGELGLCFDVEPDGEVVRNDEWDDGA